MAIRERRKRRGKRYAKDYPPHLGRPLNRAPTPRELNRFLSFVEYVDGHWIWRGYTDKKGYGQFSFDGRSHWAHRWSRQVFHGNLPLGQQAAHDEECRIPSCVCPWHINSDTLEHNAAEGNKNRDDSYEPIPF